MTISFLAPTRIRIHFATLTLTLALAGCVASDSPNPVLEQTEGSTVQPAVDEPIQRNSEWWNRLDVADTYSIIGAIQVRNGEDSARNRVATRTRNSLAETLRGLLRSISIEWSQHAGEGTAEFEAATTLNDDALIDRVVDATMIGAVVDRSQVSRGHLFVLVKLEDPSDLLDHLVSELDENSKGGGRLGEAKLERSVLRERLKAMIEEKMGPIVDVKEKTARALND